MAVFLNGMLPAAPARADTGGYPQATMPCEWFPQATSGPAGTEWCNDFDWGPAASTLLAGQETIDEPTTISPRGFGYRNCTDYVAFKLGFDASVVHGNGAQWKAQLPPEDVTSYPTVGAVAWWGTEVDQGFGHVAVVLSVRENGSALIGEYNAHLDGTYDTRVVSPRAVDAFLHIRDQGVPGGVPFRPGAHDPDTDHPVPARLAPSPAAPPPSPAAPPAPSPPSRLLAAAGLQRSLAAFVSFAPPAALRPGAEQILSATISQARARTLAAQPGDQLAATLEGPGFRIQPTTPRLQALLGGGDASWQWQVSPTQRGRQALTLCLTVVPAGEAAGPAPTCLPSHAVTVNSLASLPNGGWLARHTGVAAGLALAVAAAGLATALAVRRRRRRAGAG